MTAENAKKCKRQEPEIFLKYKSPYTTKYNKLIRDNWTEVFFSELDSLIKPNDGDANVISLKYDAMGCIYPKFMAQDMLNLGESFADNKDYYLYKYTFYHLLYPDDQEDRDDMLTVIDKNVPEQHRSQMISFANSTLMHREGESFNEIDEVRANDIYKFANLWNNVYYPDILQNINATIQQRKIDRIVIFVPGFNVPYSLAHLQGNNVIDTYRRGLGDKNKFDKILFIKLYWPSLTYKDSMITENSAKFSNMITLRTARYFNHVRNRAFNVGLQARRFLSQLNFQGEVDMIGHSTGSDIVGIILVDPIEKMNLDKKENDNPYGREMARQFENCSLPKSRIEAFLNAPSIPGVGTFNRRTLIRPEQKNYYWTIGYNCKDKVLQKLKGVRQLESFANWGGNTNLGGNVNNDVEKTILELKQMEIGQNFRFVELGKQKDLFGHDFFCYLHQSCFQSEIDLFINNLTHR